MTVNARATPDETPKAEALPQLDASSLVDRARLEAAIKDMYRQVARGEHAALHFDVGRSLAEQLGYPAELLDAIPAEALASFAGVGHHLDLAALQSSVAVLDLGSSYLAALQANGLALQELRENDYRFISERALDACNTYEVESISLRAARPNLDDGDTGGSR